MKVNTDPPKRRATLKDIAAELGVATATVSNAYNRPDQLSPALRERIFEVAERLGYAGPDPMARGLRRGQSGAIGIVHRERLSYAFSDPAASLFLQGIAREVEAGGQGLLLVSRPPGQEPELAAINSAAVDGFVVHCLTADDPLLQAVLRRQLPTVLVDQPGFDDLPYVMIDDSGGARAAAQHVLDLGHRRLGVLAFRLTPEATAGIADRRRQEATTNVVALARLRGYDAALRAVGLDWHEHVTVYECLEHTPAAGRLAAAALLAATPRPTALLAMSDQLALGVLEYAAQAGLAVPAQLSVVGFDDTPAAALASPALTTVHQPHIDKGRWAGRLLLARLRGEPSPGSVSLPTRLVVRESTAAAPGV